MVWTSGIRKKVMKTLFIWKGCKGSFIRNSPKNLWAWRRNRQADWQTDSQSDKIDRLINIVIIYILHFSNAIFFYFLASSAKCGRIK